MVLSNKKLKQKLRIAVTDSLIGTYTTGDQVKSGANSELKVLLNTARRKQRLLRREKRKILPSSQSLVESIDKNNDNEDGGLVDKDENGESKKKGKKKRKRNEVSENGDVGAEEEIGSLKKAKKEETTKKKKKKKKKKNKTKKNKAKQEVGEIEKPVNEEQVLKEADKIPQSQVNVYVDASTKVYVGGVPYYSTEEDIRSYFEPCGTITEIDCMKFMDTGKFRGIAIISFKTEAAAKRALELDGSDMGGFYLKIQPYKGSRRPNKEVDFAPQRVEGYLRIYLGNLAWDVTEDDVRKLFSDCKIFSIRFGTDKVTGEFRGYAHVEFCDSLSLSMALKLDQEIVCGRPVKISYAVPKKEGTANAPQPTPVMHTTDKTENEAWEPTSTTATENTENEELGPVSGKIKRRTCYECGQKGHLSSACPTKEGTANAPQPTPMMRTTDKTEYEAWEPMSTIENTENEELAPVSGKIKRRTCYECGQKGHLSSACPKKQT